VCVCVCVCVCVVCHVSCCINKQRPGRTVAEHRFAVWLLNDAAEYFGDRYMELTLPAFMAHIAADLPTLRQACAYGLGFTAVHGGAGFARACPNVVNALVGAIRRPDALEEASSYATDNAVAALSRICVHHRERVNMAEIIPVWLAALPLRADTDEGPGVYKMLCDLMEANDPLLLGVGNAHLQQVVGVLASIVKTEFVDEAIGARVTTLLGQVNDVAPQIVQAVWGSLEEKQQENVRAALGM